MNLKEQIKGFRNREINYIVRICDILEFDSCIVTGESIIYPNTKIRQHKDGEIYLENEIRNRRNRIH